MTARLTKERLTELIHAHRFSELFIQFGWDQGLSAALKLDVGERTFSLRRVAQKRGFVVCVCDVGENYPPRDVCRKLLRQLGKHHYEHLLIMHGAGRQCWSLSIRPQNRPLRFLEVEWQESQDAQPLMQKMDGMLFDISEEEMLSISDVVDRVRDAFMEGAEKTTKRFYERFQKELRAFSNFIKGIHEYKAWYAALMLNRLMFIYFIQKRRFLDGDSNYLQNRLKQTREQYGPDQFHTAFYRDFLRRLFAEGLDTPVEDRAPDVEERFGKIPYLNGGLFELHTVEEQNPDISIPDQAFERLFAFFDQYDWHLDSRPAASGKDINPDVLGYIFEKYINDRAAMGAYYTQEDITGYIARNTIIPFLLNRAKEQCANAFHAGGIWRLLRDNPDHYIYAAARKGCNHPDSELPERIRCGIDTAAPDLLQRRKHWNETADEQFALPTETWREAMMRRERYFALKAKMQNGGIQNVDDLVTHNLDIQRFAEDALNNYEGSDFVEAFYAAIAGRKALRSNQKHRRGVTVLDPACGSGAFLFAALNVLEPLYRQCIGRMQEFVAEDDRLRKDGTRKGSKKHLRFREVLREISQHPNEEYWIYKTIILNNLYGVDIMREAAEIAKLRLFLKLAAEAEYDPKMANLGLEPLPDIDFNIRAGNSLVGFVSMEQFEKFATSQLDLSGGLISKVREDAKLVQMANERFRDAQDRGGEDYRQAKQALADRLDDLNQGMSHYLANQYGIGHSAKPEKYAQWQRSYQPFHWLAEFYGIIEEGGGFDVVIGNPPYVPVTKVGYKLVGDFGVFKCPDLYGYMTKKALELTNPKGLVGFIVMHSLAFSRNFADVREVISEKAKSAWFSSYGRIPSGLFSS